MTIFPVLGAFESTYLPDHDVDVAETSGHVQRRLSDLRLLRECGVERVRYPVRWHRTEREPGRFDWRDTDDAMAQLQEVGLTPIVDLVHHTSYPRWLRRGFADPAFPRAYVDYVVEFAQRYPDVQQYTLFNEPLATLLLCGHEGVWPPRGSGMDAFVEILRNVLPAMCSAHAVCAELLPRAQHVWTDTCERHTGEGTDGCGYAAYANDRRFFVLDAVLGRLGADAADRPFVRDVLEHGGEELLDLDPLAIDVLGLDYYAHSQWHFDEVHGTAPSPQPAPLSELVVEHAERYRLPCMLTETNIRGFASDRATWLKYTVEQCEIAVSRGVELLGWCWFPTVDSFDWASLLTRHEGRVDPVGVFVVSEDGERQHSSVSASFAALAHGATAAELPAYELQEPVRSWLRGYRPHMAHWTWEPAPAHEIVDPDAREVEIAVADEIDFEPLGGHLR